MIFSEKAKLLNRLNNPFNYFWPLTIILMSLSFFLRNLFSSISLQYFQFSYIFILAIGIISLYSLRSSRSSEVIKRFEVLTFLFIAYSWVISVWSIDSFNSISNLLLFSMALLFVSLTVKKRWVSWKAISKDLSLIYWIVISILIAGLAAIPITPNLVFLHSRFMGFWGNPNFLGMASSFAICLGIVIAIDSRSTKKILFILSGLFLAMSCLLLSQSRGALFSLVVSLAIFGLLLFPKFPWKNFTFIALIFSLIVLLAPLRDNLLNRILSYFSETDWSSGRLEIYNNLIFSWTKSPIIGNGFRTTELLNFNSGVAAHNIYLQMLVELGIIGFILFMALMVNGFVSSFSKRRIPLLLPSALLLLFQGLSESSLFGLGGIIAFFTWLLFGAFATSRDFPESFFGSRHRHQEMIDRSFESS